ncbi:hypothetical protein [Coxiella-like endosymbiont]|nr:hypothetical protein [Coxiella-like endosymbiont]
MTAIHDLQVTFSQLQNNQTEIKSQTAILQKLQNQERETRAGLEV